LLVFMLLLSTVVIVSTALEEVEAARASPIRTSGGWSLEVVDGRNDTGYSTSIAIDAYGYRHIAYAQYNDESVYYATNFGGIWTIEKIGGPVDSEQEVSLALDADGKAHVVYMTYGSDIENLTYSTNAGGSWTSTIIGPKVSGLYNDVFIGQNGVVHIAYTQSDESWNNNVLMYMNNSGGSWNPPVDVDSNGADLGMYCSLAVSDRGTVYFAYQAETGPDRFLRLAQRSTSGNTIVSDLDNGGGVYTPGYHASLALFGDEVHVSYFDQTNFDLFYKYFDGVQWQDPVIVDESGEVGEFSSIGVDSNGVPHIAYYDGSNSALKMAEMMGTEWNTSVIDGAPHYAGRFCSLAISPDDMVCISYLDEGNYDLCLASEDIWLTGTVHSGHLVGVKSSTVLDDDGNAYVAYNDISAKDMWFATNAGGSWTTELVDSEGDVGATFSMDIDRDRNAHICYLDRGNAPSSDYYGVGYFKYANNTGGSWSITDLLQITTSYAQSSSLKVDSLGNVHIVFYNSANGSQGIWYATNAGGTWDISLIEGTNTSKFFSVGTHSQIFIDSSNILHIAYTRYYKNMGSICDVVYGTNAGGSWSFEVAAYGVSFGSGTSLGLDSSGNAHMSFHDSDENDLHYATNAGGSWVNSTVTSGIWVGYGTSLAVDSHGKAHIGFQESTNDVIVYATNAGGNWAFTKVADVGSGTNTCSIALDKGDTVHLSYYDARSSNQGLKHSTNTAWKLTTLYDGPMTFAPGQSSMKIDKNGWEHVCYYVTKNTSLMYANNVGGSWSHTLVDGAGTVQAGGFCSMALDSNGKAHISYRDSLNGHLKYANNTGRGWTNITLDDRVSVSYATSIAVDGDNKVYISYYASVSMDLKCATNKGSSWTYCVVDDSANDVGKYSSIAIQSISRTYRPHISYYDATAGDLKYAEFTGSTWTTASWTLTPIYVTASDTGKFNSLALDKSGNAFVSFYDGTYNRLMLASNADGHWDYMTVDQTAGMYSSMVRSGTGALYIAYYDDVNQDLKLAVNINGGYPTDGGWGITAVDCVGDVGEWPSICLGLQNTVHISYVDDTRDALKHAQTLAEPSAPFGLTAQASSDDVVLSWSSPKQDNGMIITGYVLERTTVANATVDLIEVGNVLTYSDIDLENGDYSYRVAALNAIGTSAYSTKADVTVDVAVITAPAAPDNVVTYAHDGMVELVWQAPLADGGSSITNYKVYRGDSSGNLVLWSTLGNVLTYLDFNVVNGQTYYYAISAENGVGEGPPSAEVSETPASLPSAPLNLTAALDGDDVILNWERPLDDGGAELSYNLYRGEVSGDLVLLIALGNVTTYTDIDIGIGQTYFYQVAAENSVGEGPMSNEVSSNADLPSAPALSATSDGVAVTLTWVEPAETGSSAITNYRVYRGLDSGSMSLLIELGDVLTYEDETVTTGQTYVYQVSAVNDQGEGPRSNQVSLQIGAVPSEPIHVGAMTDGAGIMITWDEPEDDGGFSISGYKVYRGTSAASLTLRATLGVVLNFTDLDLVAGTEYYYAVTALNAKGEGPQSDVVMMGANSAPSAPLNLELEAGNGTVSLSWDAPTSTGGSPITGYKVYRGTSESDLTLLASVGAVTTYVDDEVVNDQTYYYKVSAINAVGEGPLSEVEDATPTDEGGDGDGDGGDNTLIYIIIAVVVIAALAAVAFIFLRKK